MNCIGGDPDEGRRDLAGRLGTLGLIWGLPIALMVLTLLLAGGGCLVASVWTVSLSVMGAACLINARGCGRVHCYFTGPFFLAMAAASLAYGLHRVPLGPHGWNELGAITLVGGCMLCCVPEWLLGRYRTRRADSGRRSS